MYTIALFLFHFAMVSKNCKVNICIHLLVYVMVPFFHFKQRCSTVILCYWGLLLTFGLYNSGYEVWHSPCVYMKWTTSDIQHHLWKIVYTFFLSYLEFILAISMLQKFKEATKPMSFLV
jgi:hypothetical protein